MYSSRVRNIELPENLFSNLGEIKSKNIAQKKKLISEEKTSETKENYLKDNSAKLTNFSKHKDYRTRIDKMYEIIKIIFSTHLDSVLFVTIITIVSNLKK